MKNCQTWFSKSALIWLLPQAAILFPFFFSQSHVLPSLLITPLVWPHGLPEAALLKVSHVSFKVTPHGLSSASASLTYLQIWQQGNFLTKLSPFLFYMFLFCSLNICSSYCPINKKAPWGSLLKALLRLHHLSPGRYSWEPRQQFTKGSSFFFFFKGTAFISFPCVREKPGEENGFSS